MEEADAPSLLPQAAEEEVSQHVVGADELQGIVKKLGQHNEVHPHVLRPGPLHLVHRVLVEEQQLPRPQGQGRAAVDPVHRLAAAHVHDLHVVVGVGREGGEPVWVRRVISSP